MTSDEISIIETIANWFAIATSFGMLAYNAGKSKERLENVKSGLSEHTTKTDTKFSEQEIAIDTRFKSQAEALSGISKSFGDALNNLELRHKDTIDLIEAKNREDHKEFQLFQNKAIETLGKLSANMETLVKSFEVNSEKIDKLTMLIGGKRRSTDD